MSRVVQFTQFGAPDVLKLVDVNVPEPKSNEVRIRVKALGLNRAEAMFRQGRYLETAQFPAKLGYEAAGIVDAVGGGVKHVKPGDAVSTVPNFSMNEYGVYGEVVIAPDYAVVKHPANLSFEEAAAIWMMYLTAYDALIATGLIKNGSIVLIPAASSSVGLAAIQLVNDAGGVSVALTRTSKKAQQLKDAGAAHVIATEEQDLVAEVKKISGGKGANVAFDPVGGSTFAKLGEASAPGATLILYGALSPEPTVIRPLDMIGKCLTVKGALLMTTSGDPEKLKVGIEYISKGLASGALKPIIAKVFPFDEIVESHKYLEANQQFGKIVVSVP